MDVVSRFGSRAKEELAMCRHDETEIEDRFYRHLTFGTAGLRGLIGAGTNRMNRYTVRRASEGFARYLLNQSDAPEKGLSSATIPATGR